jgi:hypothetical protein
MALLPPRVAIMCPFGHRTRTRNPPGSQLPCVRCNQDSGRTVMITVPAGPDNSPTLRPPEPPPTPAALAQVTRRRTGPAQVQCSGCHATAELSVPLVAGEPAGWLTLGAGTPDGPDGRKSELLARCCSAECLAVILPRVKERLAELPYQPPDRPSSARSVAALMSERPRPR